MSDLSKLNKKKNNKIAYLMVSPYIIYFLVFMAYPLIFSIVLVFNKWDIVSPMHWVGLKNIVRLFHDQLFFQSLINTGIFLIINIPLQIFLALIFAVLLNERIRGRFFFRAVYFMPVVVSGVVITILWQQLYSEQNGVLNLILFHLGLPKIAWLRSPVLAMPSIALMATWKNVGLYVVLFLAGLQSIPKYLYEVADIDGATDMDKFLRITVPMLNPTMILVVILSTLGGFALFIEPYVLTGGGPMGHTMSTVLYIYKEAMLFGRMGYAASLAFVYTLIIFGVVIVQRKVIEQEY